MDKMKFTTLDGSNEEASKFLEEILKELDKEPNESEQNEP